MWVVSSLWWLVGMGGWVLLVGLNLLLSPLCILSSSLYEWALHWTLDLDDQTLLLILLLVGVWAASAVCIFDLIRGRSAKSLFFY